MRQWQATATSNYLPGMLQMKMKRNYITYLFFVLLSLTGCNSDFIDVLLFPTGSNFEVSADPNDYIGEYVFKPFNTNIEKFANLLILKKDFTAVEIRYFNDIDHVFITETKWRVFTYPGTKPCIVIEDRRHPIEKSGKIIKLINNYDLGMYYEKVR